jgi:hypothetical protein
LRGISEALSPADLADFRRMRIVCLNRSFEYLIFADTIFALQKFLCALSLRLCKLCCLPNVRKRGISEALSPADFRRMWIVCFNRTFEYRIFEDFIFASEGLEMFAVREKCIFTFT